MGCDIHAHSEIKVNDVWHHYTSLDFERDYVKFAKLCGVRNWRDSGIIPLSDTKGFPHPDVSFTTMFDYRSWKSDAHSLSWISSIEYVKFCEWWRNYSKQKYYSSHKDWGWLFGNNYEGFLDCAPGEYPGELQDFRFIFWFDN